MSLLSSKKLHSHNSFSHHTSQIPCAYTKPSGATQSPQPTTSNKNIRISAFNFAKRTVVIVIRDGFVVAEAKLRRAWLALQPSERERMMEATSDPTFPEGTDGVLDERTRTGRQLRLSRTRNRTETQHRLPTQEPLADLLLAGSTASNRPRIRDDVEHAVVEGELPRIFRAMTSVDTLNSARVNFYRVVEQETLVQLQADYNQGSLSGSIGIPRDRPSACAPSSRTSPPLLPSFYRCFGSISRDQ